MCYLQQSNNAYIFPGLGLGLVISGAIRVHEDMLLAACKSLQTESVGHKKSFLIPWLDETRDQSHVSFIQTAAALADQATDENFVKGSIFPPFTNIRKISAHIAAAVAAKAYELGTHVLCFALQTPFHILILAFTTKSHTCLIW